MDKYQTFQKRFWAGFLDGIIVTLIIGIFVFFFNLFAPTPRVNGIYSALTGIVSIFYFILMHNYFGQTIGKMATKVKVLDVSEKPINFGQAVLRSLPQLIPVMFSISILTADSSTKNSLQTISALIYGSVWIFYFTDVIVCLFNEKDRSLHDFIAGTVVIRTDA